MVSTTTKAKADPLEDLDQTGDIIEDTLRVCLALAPGFSAALAKQIDAEVRARWAGDRPYIAAHAGEGRSTRNDAIIKSYIAGDHINFLARRHGLTPRRILQIIKGK